MNPGNAGSTEPITAAPRARPGQGLARSRAGLLREGNLFMAGRPDPTMLLHRSLTHIHTGPCHKQKELLEKQTALGNEKIQQQRR